MNPIVKATESDFSEINDLLNSVSLPWVETDNCPRYFFVSKNTENKIIASIGLEIYGTYGLLRSLAVDPDNRNKGIALLLIDEIIKQSHALQLKAVYLLTTTADKYFLKNGFEDVQRNDIPEELTHSQEYSSICPASAITMRKSL
jgi:N-acetylglutamate synthase-like GNAT family acetyltransferase